MIHGNRTVCANQVSKNPTELFFFLSENVTAAAKIDFWVTEERRRQRRKRGGFYGETGHTHRVGEVWGCLLQAVCIWGWGVGPSSLLIGRFNSRLQSVKLWAEARPRRLRLYPSHLSPIGAGLICPPNRQVPYYVRLYLPLPCEYP